MSIDLENYFDVYPFINVPIQEFNDKIFEQELLHEDPPEPRLRHQHFIAQFMNFHTLYDELLLFHVMGTGKTCTATSVCEELVYNPSSPYMRVFWIVPNNELIQEHIRQIASICTPPSKYPIEQPNLLDDPLKHEDIIQRRYRAAIRNVYQFYTFDGFARAITGMEGDLWNVHFGKSIIVIDEAHHLVNSQHYPLYHDFLHKLHQRKILLMTGTPMVNSPIDFAFLMNLILPSLRQMDTRNFLTTFFDDKTKLLKESSMEDYVKGRVSFLKADSIKPVIQGCITAPLRHTFVYSSKLSSHQESVYTTIQANDRSGFYQDTQQAALIVFPDKTIGAEGFSKHVSVKRTHHSFSTEMLYYFKHQNDEEKLKTLHTFSAKYATIIQYILKYPKEKVFVYIDSIHEGGAIVFACFLQLFGFGQYKGKQDGKKHYSILSSEEDLNYLSFQKILRAYNHNHNKHGKDIQVMIGGRKIVEGFTFKNVKQIHIVRPHWNFSVLDQAVGRCLRAFSHAPNTIVKLFYHAIQLHQHNVLNIDLYMYKESENKDRYMKQIEHYIKRSAFDCTFFYERNSLQQQLQIAQYSYSRFCEYKPCVYECITSYKPPYKSLEFQTHPLQQTIEYITQQLVSRQCVKISELIQSISPMRLYTALQHLENQSLEYQHITMYVCIDKNVVFLHPLKKAIREDLYYLRNIYSESVQPIESLFQTDYIFEKMVTTGKMELVKLLPHDLQLLFLKVAYECMYHRIGEIDKAYVVLQVYQQYINKIQHQIIINFCKPPIMYDGKDWIVYEGEILETEDMLEEAYTSLAVETNVLVGKAIHEVNSKEMDGTDGNVEPLQTGKEPTSEYPKNIQDIVPQPILDSFKEVYGVLSNGKLKIVDIRKSKRARGRVIQTYPKQDLIELCMYFGINVEHRTKQALCRLIHAHLEAHKLLHVE